MFEFPFDLIILVGAGFFAGFVNTMAGGGSLLTLPLLIFLGLPPATANGTNRIAILVSTVRQHLDFKVKILILFLLVFIWVSRPFWAPSLALV